MRQARRDQLALAVGMFLIALWGIWRVDPHFLWADTAGSVEAALLLLDRGVIHSFGKGGNAHLRLLNGAWILALPYWLATEQVDILLNWPGANSVIHDPVLRRTRNDALVIARLVSVGAAVVTAVLAYRLARRLWDRRAGLVAAATLCVSMGFVTTATMASEDVPAAAAMLAVVSLLVAAIQDDSEQHLIYAALALGLAGSIKAVGGVLIPAFTLGAVWVLRERYPWRQAALQYAGLGYASLGVYIVTTPSMLAYPVHWINQMHDLFFSTVDQSAWPMADPWPVMWAAHTAVLLSLPLFVLSLAAVGVVVSRDRRRPIAVLAVALGALVAFMWVVNSPQYFRPVPTLPLLAVFVGGLAAQVRRSPRERTRAILTALTAAVLVFAALYTATAVVPWNTTRDAATDGMDQLEPNATVAATSQELYLPAMPKHVQFRKYHDELAQDNQTARQQALVQYRNYCADYLVVAHNYYHRHIRAPQVQPNVSRTVLGILSGIGSEYRVVGHYGPPRPARNDAAWIFEESLTFRHYGNSVGNAPITILEPTREPTASCDHRPDLYDQ